MITAERDRLSAENAELQDRLLRGQAEFQNLRKRVERERMETLEYASIEAVRTLLPVDKAETEDAAEDTVLEEFQRGYNFKGRLLRAAMVKVAVRPSSAS